MNVPNELIEGIIQAQRNPKILRLVRQCKEAQDKKVKLISEIQEICEHNHVVECDYIPHNYLGSIPPRRKCLNCGVEEAGWGCGYKTLRDRDGRHLFEVEREYLYKLRY